MAQARKLLSRLMGFASCGVAGALLAWGWLHLDEPLGVIALVLGAAYGVSLIVSWFGMRRSVGRRLLLQPAVFFRTDHRFLRLDDAEARAEWRALGQDERHLVAGWRCSGHCATKQLLGNNGERPYYVYPDAPGVPWATWSAGLFLVMARDPRHLDPSLLRTGEDGQPAGPAGP